MSQNRPCLGWSVQSDLISDEKFPHMIDAGGDSQIVLCRVTKKQFADSFNSSCVTHSMELSDLGSEQDHKRCNRETEAVSFKQMFSQNELCA